MSIPEHPAGPERVGNDRVFVLRFWIERDSVSNAGLIWRARVSDIASGREKHLDGVEAALNYVRDRMTNESL